MNKRKYPLTEKQREVLDVFPVSGAVIGTTVILTRLRHLKASAMNERLYQLASKGYIEIQEYGRGRLRTLRRALPGDTHYDNLSVEQRARVDEYWAARDAETVC